MKDYFVDLHVHIGRSSNGNEIKRATAKNLTFENIAFESYTRKGIDVIGVVDCISPYVIEDIERLIEKGELREKKGGGMEYRKGQVLILGAELETHEKRGCSAHSLCFFPSLKTLKDFAKDITKHIKNIYNCSSICRLTGQQLFDMVEYYGGTYIPAHIFTPHKSFYGNCCDSLLEIFNEKSFEKIPAIELGLSADSMMASQLSELDGKVFLSNSDAHSLIKMGREYNVFQMEEPSFEEILKAFKGIDGRSIKANYGLDPKLGKYHRSYCLICDRVIEGQAPVLKCPVSEKHQVVVGVRDRLMLIKDRDNPRMNGRPPYRYQVPLEFLPKVGPKTIDKLINHFGSEMNVLHQATFEELAAVAKEEIARNIILSREGKLSIEAGGGGVYGKVEA
ncbi:MAG TPA: endonuclease Q family protein [Acetivibrio sp.]|jgi:uncharacterized protein (TIGR00375 family)|nr:TIGR00375 family protein [Clostridium sp.]HOQ36882.1 endonuclease Q family protein [Acetivibrio sp.]HPT89976.1 endonuclease Q family protein [Acetivibrio sp.]HQA58249.1 endonuclease Q family protein [Acetivibrio sp.]